MRRIWKTVAGASLCLSAAVFAAQPSGTLVEKETKQQFDAVIDGGASGRSLVCTGVGVRKMTAFGVKIYAAAHWIDPAAAAGALSAWKGESADALATDQAFFDALAGADVEKRLRLVFVRAATGKQVSEGFGDSLKITYPTLPPEAKQFLGMVQSKLSVGDSLELRWLPGGTIEVYEKGALKGAIADNPAFGAAVWKMWFGGRLNDGHLATLKPELVSSIAALWAAPTD